ncbi:aminotransferase class V-fold PLP-dependent enzyme [Aldersonia sp. NBC_00410]|uniref:aminotransferase class V-fold PLP-dependent enzyme n=1 Tax=Aldersonia sp. NBC_00410 TaxID=2975954 RepID=UPI00225224A6|nr:aminotransferase class V-fold PLP-dependent enzyme [Aldersonia sp. NBC_00410]MCX5043191.1 aminotransferase class V-fold PLP-dependent enzyme [Aldersonia sp. NBC_00410]
MTAVLEIETSCATAAPVGPAPICTVSGADLNVPLVQGGSCTYANFDYAASAPALAAVTDRVHNLLPYYASVHRGAGYASRVSTACYESARTTVARFVGASPDQVVVFTRNTTDSLNLLAACVPGDTVVLDIEHHANLLAWRRGRRVVTAADTIEETIRRIVAELCSKPAALLAITGASNVTGEVLPIARLADIAHRCGARILVDAAQLAPHRRIDLAECGVDYLAFSGHKLYAPFGAGVLVGRRDWLDVAQPYLAGGGAVREVTTTPARAQRPLDVSAEWAPAPQRHEAGSPNVLGAAALAAACEALADLDTDLVQAHERVLCDRLRAGLSAVPGVELLRAWSDSTDCVGIVAFAVAGHEPGEVAAYLSAEHGIGVRDGRFCAHPFLARLGHDAAVRASIGLGSSAADVDRLVGAIGQLVADGPGWTYAKTDGHWNPAPETRPFLVADAGATAGSAPCAIVAQGG